jgi:putative peptidoglycan lipid II flippase
MIKGFRQIASLTAVSRVFGLIRDVCFAHFFGAGWLMTAWTMGFKVPNLSRRLFGEGAASASFIPVYTEQLHQNPEQARKLANTVVTVIFVILAALVLIGETVIWIYYGFETRTGPRLGLILCFIMMPYMVLVCTVAVLGGILNVHRHFAMPAAAPIVLNIFIISSTLVTGWLFGLQAQQQVIFVALAVLLAGLVQIIIQLIPLRSKGISIRPAWEVKSEAFRKVIVLIGPMILGLTVTQINTLADDLIALGFMTKDGYPLSYGAPSYLYYSQRLYQFPLGVLGISLATAIFPVMSAEAARKDIKALCKTISKGLSSAIFIAFPSTAGLILVAKPLIAVLFEHGQFTTTDTPIVAWTLGCYAFGLTGFFSQQILTRAFYSLQDSRWPAKSAVLAVIVNVVLNITLIWFMGTAGLALSTAICSYLQVLILAFVLRSRFEHPILEGLTATFFKALAATAVMFTFGSVILLLMKNMPSERFFNIIRLAVTVPLSAGAYILLAKLFKIEMLSLLTGRKK